MNCDRSEQLLRIVMFKRMPFPPGPKGIPFIGNIPLMAADPLALYSKWAKEYGDIFCYRPGPFRLVYFLNHPSLVEQLLVTQAQNFQKDWVLRNARWLFGNGLLTSEGETWKRQRRISQPMFHRERIASYAATMVAYTKEGIADWKPGEARSIHRDMMQLTLRIASKILFGIDIGSDTGKFAKPLKDLPKAVSGARMLIPSYLHFLPLPGLQQLRLTVKELDVLVYELIAQRRLMGEQAHDLLSMMLEVRDEDSNGMSAEEVRDEVITFLLAGHGTTAMALTWTWYLLSGHPAVADRMYEEVQKVLSGRSATFADIGALAYTSRIVRESMRLYPPVWAFGRTATRECEIAGYRIPKGADVLASQWTMHRDPRFFDDPEHFDPDRWDSPRTQHLPKLSYFPFGGGGRMCIGASFAMTEAVLVLATIAQKFCLHLKEGHPVVPVPGFTLGPKYGIKMIVGQRG